MTMKPESRLKQKVLADLKRLSMCYAIKLQEVGRHGVPDIFVCLKGDFVAIELKSGPGKATMLQEITLDNIRKAGGMAFVANEETWPYQFKVLSMMHD